LAGGRSNGHPTHWPWPLPTGRPSCWDDRMSRERSAARAVYRECGARRTVDQDMDIYHPPVVVVRARCREVCARGVSRGAAVAGDGGRGRRVRAGCACACAAWVPSSQSMPLWLFFHAAVKKNNNNRRRKHEVTEFELRVFFLWSSSIFQRPLF
jgi:hypothetical protein